METRDPRDLYPGPLTFVGDLDHPVIAQEDLFHLFRVRRHKSDQPIVIGDGNGSLAAFKVSLSAASRGLEVAEIHRVGEIYRETAPIERVGVAMFIPKGDRLSWAIQKLTEVGVDDIFLLSSTLDRRGGATPSPHAGTRLERVAKEASSQSRRSYLPKVHPAKEIGEFLAIYGTKAALCDKAGTTANASRSIWVVGPEAGHRVELYDLPKFTLSSGVLRVETAAVVAGALLVAFRGGLAKPIDE